MENYYDNEIDFDDEYIERMNREAEEEEKTLAEAQQAARLRLDELATAIKTWDKLSAYELCDYLNEFENICNDVNLWGYTEQKDLQHELNFRNVDLINLPCADVDIYTSWENIYAVDVNKRVVFPTQQGWDAEEFDPNTDYSRK